MEESAEAQEKVCRHFTSAKWKKGRPRPMHAIRAEDECRQVLVQFPNSPYAAQAEQKLRDIQEVLAAGEYKVGKFYQNKGQQLRGANRLPDAGG